jgi:hypothetical protein
VAQLARRYSKPRLSLSVRCVKRRWRALVGGPDAGEVLRAGFRVGHLRAPQDAKPPFERSISAKTFDRDRRRWSMRVQAMLIDGRVVGLRRPIGRCGA